MSRPPGTGPARWTSAWPSLRGSVLAGVATTVLTVPLTLAGTVWLGDLSRAWWVALLPLPLLVVPLSRPARTRAAFVRAAARGTLQVRTDIDGQTVLAGRRRARLGPRGEVGYLP